MNTHGAIDLAIKQLYSHVDDRSFDWAKTREDLESLLGQGVKCLRDNDLELVKRFYNDDRNIRVLDYGCGSGIYVILMLLKGYSEVHGVDIYEKFDNRLLKNLGFVNASFGLVGDRLPFEDNYFDVVNSSLVLEHVKNIDLYYKESARVLKPDGICLFNFPHRLKPYDSHSRTWFIHYFPRSIRKLMWNFFSRQGGEFLNDFINLRTISYHKRISRKYFKKTKDITKYRIKNFNPDKYKGNKKIRGFANYLMNIRYIGNIFVKIFSINASVDLYLKK